MTNAKPQTGSGRIQARSVKLKPGKNKLLFVDDDRVSRMAMASLLTRHGYAIDDVDSGPEALVKLESGNYDAVVIDFRMPQMTGLELAACIRGKYSGVSNPPILVALTGGLSTQEQEHAKMAFDKIVAKPIGAGALSATLAKALTRT